MKPTHDNPSTWPRHGRFWINQPSTLQPLHRFHGKRLIAIRERDPNWWTAFFCDDDQLSSILVSTSNISLGWPERPISVPDPQENRIPDDEQIVRLQEEIATLELQLSQREQELEGLREWKKSAMFIFTSLDMQKVAVLLGVTLGQDCASFIAKRVPELVRELDLSKDALKESKSAITGLRDVLSQMGANGNMGMDALKKISHLESFWPKGK